MLGAWSQLPGQRLADLGTGTGLLAFMLAQRYPKAHLMAIERDPEMADIARKNVAESPFAERIQVVGQDVHEFAQQHPASFDGLIVNPPFFINQLPRAGALINQAIHADEATLPAWLESINCLLTPGGVFNILLPPTEVNAFCARAVKQGFALTNRLAICHRPGATPIRYALRFGHTGPLVEETLFIRDADGAYSSTYRQLLGGFNTIF